MEPKFSIIIPVYNVEDYLEQCYDSIINQNFKNFEIIIVADNSSSDKSIAISEKYCRIYSNMEMHRRGHYGLGDARNYGIQYAKGEYLIFVDSDDFWKDRDFLRTLNTHISSLPEFVVFHYQKLLDGHKSPIKVGKKWRITDKCNKTIEKKIHYLVSSSNFSISAWSKVIKKDFLIKNKLYFSNGYCEDIDWTMTVLSKVKTLEIVCSDSYVHRIRNGSLAHDRNKKQCEDLFNIVYKHSTILKDNRNNLLYNDALLSYLCYEYFILLGIYFIVFPNGEDQKMWEEIVNLKWLMNYGINKKSTICKIICKTLGLQLGGKIFAHYIVKK